MLRTLFLDKRYLALYFIGLISMPCFAYKSFTTKISNQQREYTVAQRSIAISEDEEMATQNTIEITISPWSGNSAAQSPEGGHPEIPEVILQFLALSNHVTFQTGLGGIIHAASSDNGQGTEGQEEEEPNEGEGEQTPNAIWLTEYLSLQANEVSIPAGQQILLPEIYSPTGPVFTVATAVTFYPVVQQASEQETTLLQLHLTETANPNHHITMLFTGNAQHATLHAHNGFLGLTGTHGALPFAIVELSNGEPKKKNKTDSEDTTKIRDVNGYSSISSGFKFGPVKHFRRKSGIFLPSASGFKQ